MMIGELEYDDLMYSTEEKIVFSKDGNQTSANMVSEVQNQYYPFSAYFLMLVFIILFSIIIMNLLFGLAVSDVQVRKKVKIEITSEVKKRILLQIYKKFK